MRQNLALRGDCTTPHSFTPEGGRFGKVAALPFDLTDWDPGIEVMTRFREDVKPRFHGFFCGSCWEVAAAIWSGERKSENEDTPVGGTGRGVWLAGVKTRGLPTRVSASQSWLISSNQHTNYILIVVVWGKAVSHGGVGYIH